MRSCSLKLVNARPMPFTCPVPACVAKFAEQKEVYRHVELCRDAHRVTKLQVGLPLIFNPAMLSPITPSSVITQLEMHMEIFAVVEKFPKNKCVVSFQAWKKRFIN
jgi:hypothetical protein